MLFITKISLRCPWDPNERLISHDCFNFTQGEVFWEADVKEAPFSPEPIPAWTDNSRMVYIWVTDYTPNTFFYQAHTNGYLKYNVTKKDVGITANL